MKSVECIFLIISHILAFFSKIKSAMNSNENEKKQEDDEMVRQTAFPSHVYFH